MSHTHNSQLAIRNSLNSLIVITGFMGVGKTSVGQIVAAKLGREFVDTDVVIEEREGTTIRLLFETRGETYFRACESQVCAELAKRENLVIATGGGALVDPRNRAAFANALVVCLDATADAILERLHGAHDRPLLASANPLERIEELQNARRVAYAQIERHIDTTGKTIEAIAEEVMNLFQTQTIRVTTPDGTYPIFVGAGLLTQVGALIAKLSANDPFSPRCAIVTNPQVGELYAARVIASLRENGFEPCLIQVPEGETFKTLDTVQLIYNQLIDVQLDRRSIVFALGGGVIGDMTGFAAATFLRGVHFVQLPTTLLAMVDSSVGGKVAVDHARGKNLIGAFKQPRAVIADTDTLATLPPAEFCSGMAETVKHGIISGAELFDELDAKRGNWESEVGGWLARAIQVKVDIVGRDPFEQGERAKLNLGHTFGHALEKRSAFRLRHGDAVAIGMMCAARLAMQRGVCDQQFVDRIEKLLREIGLPTRVPREMSATEILAAMTTDKKRVAARLRFVLPRALGDVVIVDDVTREEIVAAIEGTRE